MRTQLSLQQINKQRRTDQCRDRAHRQFARRNDRPRNRVRNDYEGRACERRGNNHDAIVTTDRKPNEMRYNEADVTNRPARRDRCTHEQTRGEPVEILINNAGFGVRGRFDQTDWDAEARLVQVNITAAEPQGAKAAKASPQ